MTYDEHVTRAMLMGRTYDPRDHTYCLPSRPSAQGRPSAGDMLDADTMEPVANKRTLNIGWLEAKVKRKTYHELREAGYREA